MISLFLDTSSKKLTIYLVKDNDILYEKIIETKNDHATYFVSLIDEALKENNLETKDINKVYVVNGPGSFTGTRIGVTVGKTIAYSNNIGAIPVSSLKQFIFSYTGSDYYVSVIREKNDRVYYGIYDKDYNNVIEDKYSTISNLLNDIDKLDGEVLIVSNEEIDNIKTIKQELDIFKLMDYYKDKEVISHLLKPNYLKKIEAEEKL